MFIHEINTSMIKYTIDKDTRFPIIMTWSKRIKYSSVLVKQESNHSVSKNKYV